MISYIVNAIDQTTGIPNITYTLSDGSQYTEDLANVVGMDATSLDDYLINIYIPAFESGKQIEQTQIDPSVTALIGKTQS